MGELNAFNKIYKKKVTWELKLQKYQEREQKKKTLRKNSDLKVSRRTCSRVTQARERWRIKLT